MSSSVVVAVVVLVGVLIAYTMRGGSSNAPSKSGQKSTPKSSPKSRSTSWGYATHKSHGTKRTVKLERPWWPQLDRIGIELFDVKTKNPEGLAGTYVDVWAMGNPSWDDDGERRLEFEGGKVVKDDDGVEFLDMNRKYYNAQKNLGMLCRWSTEKAPRPMDKKDVYSVRLDVFTLTAPWPWNRSKDDPFYVSFAYIDNRVKKGLTPEEIANEVEAKWEKDRVKRERQAAKGAPTS